MKRVIAAVTATLLVSLALAGTAFAHAQYVSSSPAPGQTLATPPATATITFSEELGAGSTVSVTNASGATVSTGVKISDDHLQLVVTLTPGLPSGVYKVSWHSIAADDQGILDGTFFFGVGVPAPSTATLPAADATGLALALVAFAAIAGLVSFRTLRAAKA